MNRARAEVIEFPEHLPVSGMRDEISKAISAHQVVIVAGETGSGKTTQLPKIALSLGRKAIAHTQPRRIAARAVAERIAEELGSELGKTVGYQVRFTDKSNAETRIKLMTDGILLNAIHHDRLLKRYDTIIIDEAHERSLNIDFLLGYLKTLLPKRPDLKVIITSATIDPESFAAHFNDAPIISVSGRTYPVEVRYRPLITVTQTTEGKTLRTERDLHEGICDAVAELLPETPGDILVFLAGEGDIRDAADALQGRFKSLPAGRTLEVLPLYGRLSAADQHRVFSPTAPGVRRVVLATNVAETSLTVPGVTAVIDSGAARISRYSSKSKVQRLPIEAVAKASATQRAGRAGRTSPGITIRLYSEADFLSRPEFSDPEILRTGLASVLLQMLSLRLGEVRKFPFLTPPDPRGVRDGLALLSEIGALQGKSITPVGRVIARLPLEPRYARMVIEAKRYGVLDRVLPLVAGLTIPDVRERPEEQRAKADSLHARFKDPLGDLHTLLNLYDHLREAQASQGSSAFRRQLKSEFLNVVRVREWFDLVRQLEQACRDIELPKNLREKHPTAPGTASELVLYCALAGLLSHLGVRTELGSGKTERAKLAARGRNNGHKQTRGSEYLGSRGTRFTIFPGSVLAKNPPDFVMAVELVETSRLFARMNAKIDPAWAESLAGSLAKSSISEPTWSASRGSAIAYEKVTLFGVPIVGRRRVQLSKFDRRLARELFIREALVAGDWREQHTFDRHNHALRRELEQLEEQTRQRGLVGDETAVYAFYDERIPDFITSATDFNTWWGKTKKREPKFLHLSKADLISAAAQTTAAAASLDFPRVWQFGDQQLGLKYRFEPGASDDGVTVTVPLPLLPRLDESAFEKLVPGLRHELVAALIKTLPKPIRKHVVPANQWATVLLDATSGEITGDSQQALTAALAKEIRRRASVPVTADDFDLDRLPSHLRPTFRVVDARGRTLETSKNLAELQNKHQSSATKNVAAVAQRELPKQALEQQHLTAWPTLKPDNTIPEFLDAKFSQARARAAGSVRAYPCLIDKGKSVDLGLAADKQTAKAQHRLGVRRLIALSSPPLGSYIREHLTQQEKLLLAQSPYNSLDDLIADIALAIAEQAAIDASANGDGLIYTQADFDKATQNFAGRVLADSYSLISVVVKIADAARAAKQAINSAKSLTVLSQVSDAATQLGQLYFASQRGKGFISNIGVLRLPRLVTYLKAIEFRLEQLAANPGRDRANQNEIEAVTAEFIKAGGTLPLKDAAPHSLRSIRWQLEELRVSLFAQQLGTAEKVSPQRIRRAIAELSPAS
ncbi:ATP-dependent RNA helicase HrpA [Canibacter zhoujuaniae]|uniref:ATP-dependent RNA helicase HrpA n=1 Tax=Canibacter zhoujuaniae TaxID=2708343 RepID=UPI00142093FE|nr:ATP-dependent RNA helicase HrpA [Canibacter zhoujuaniae]